MFERLHSEIKNKQKELSKGAGKSSKAVDKARADTQKHVERLGAHTSTYHGLTAKDADNDPYVLHRGINHRLNKQVGEENSNRQDLLAVQRGFSQFETHIVQTFQQGLAQFNTTVGSQADQQKQLYSITAQTAQAVDPNHEWNLFVRRNDGVLIDPQAPAKTLDNATFPNQHHESTRPMCQGTLERKSGMLRKFDSSFYVITPSRFFHEFKSDDDTNIDPTPELSLFLPDCSTGMLNGNLFSLKGKDVSKGKLGSAVSMSKDYEFRASNGDNAQTWYNIIIGLIGKAPQEVMSPTSPKTATSPTNSLPTRERENAAMSPTSPTSAQDTGVTQQPQITSGHEGAMTQYAAGTSPTSTSTHDMAGASPTTAPGQAS